jgi:hypothetical protein
MERRRDDRPISFQSEQNIGECSGGLRTGAGWYSYTSFPNPFD